MRSSAENLPEPSSQGGTHAVQLNTLAVGLDCCHSLQERAGLWTAPARCSHRGVALLKDDPAAHIFTHGRLLAWQRLMKSIMPERATTAVGSIFSRCSVAMAV